MEDPQKAAQIKPEARWEAEHGALASAADFCEASAKRTTWYQAALRLFEQADFLVLPTAQVFPFDINERWPREIAGRQMDTYHRWMEVTIPASLAGLPAVSIPIVPNVPDAASMPHQMTGYQVIGRPQDDYGVLEIAAKNPRISTKLSKSGALSRRISTRDLSKCGQGAACTADVHCYTYGLDCGQGVYLQPAVFMCWCSSVGRAAHS